MTNKELQEKLAMIPDNAIIYNYADEGQTEVHCGSVMVTDSDDLPYYGDELKWQPLAGRTEDELLRTTGVVIG